MQSNQNMARVPGGEPVSTSPERALEKGRDHAFAWLLNAVMKPWRDAGVAHDLLANGFALKQYRWMVRFAEEMLRGVIRAHAAEIKFYAVNPPEPVQQRSIPKIPKIPPIRPIRGDFYFRMREAPSRGEAGPQGRMSGKGPRKSPDLTLTGLRLMLRAQAVETALYQAKRYAWRYARAQARRASPPPLPGTSHRPAPPGPEFAPERGSGAQKRPKTGQRRCPTASLGTD